MWKTGPVKFNDIDSANLKEVFPLKTLRHTEYKLTWEQKILLKECGVKMQAFMDGTLIPIFWNRKGKHFVDMCNGLVEPYDEYERIWKSYLLTLEEEKRLEVAWQEQKRKSPEYEEYFKSRYLVDENIATDEKGSGSEIGLSESEWGRRRKCPICQAAMEDCWKCGGRGWL